MAIPAPGAEAAVDCRGLSKRFGAVRAVDAVSFEVERGGILIFVGPDGAGKTTLIRMLCGVYEADGGTAIICGDDVVTDPEAVKARVGYMPQRFSLYGDLTLMENLRFFADLYDIPRAQFVERSTGPLESFGLMPFRTRLARELSGGMKQKLALAATMVHQPEVLFLDEPTAGVDPVSRRSFWRMLYRLNSTGITLIVSTPYMDEAERASHVGLMDRGKLIAFGDPASIKSQIDGEVVEIVTDRRTEARVALRRLQEVKSIELFGDRLHALVGSAKTAIPAIQACMRNSGIPVASIDAVPPSLEDAFVARLSAAPGEWGG